jgi:hypothetical protein
VSTGRGPESSEGNGVFNGGAPESIDGNGVSSDGSPGSGDGRGVFRGGGSVSSEGKEGGAWISSSVAAPTATIPKSPTIIVVKISVTTVRLMVKSSVTGRHNP